LSAPLPEEIQAWCRRKRGRRVEQDERGGAVLVDVLPPNDARQKLGTAEIFRAFPTVTAAAAAAAL
jgi:hypothetical protein